MQAGLVPAMDTGMGLPLQFPKASQVPLVQPLVLVQGVPASEAAPACVMFVAGVQLS